MLGYIVHRLLVMIPTLLVISVFVFIIIQLPPGDYLTTMVAELQSQGEEISRERLEYLRQEFGIGEPLVKQYFVWLGGLLQGNLGYSFKFELPVSDVIGDRAFLTVVVSFTTILFVYIVAFLILIIRQQKQLLNSLKTNISSPIISFQLVILSFIPGDSHSFIV